MKTGRENSSEDGLVNMTNMETEAAMENNKNPGISISFLPMLSVSATVLAGIVRQTQGIELLKTVILTLILTYLSVFFIRWQEDNIMQRRFTKEIMIGGYLLPLLLILLPLHPEVYCFWLIGSLMVAMLVDLKLGLLFVFNHTFLLSFTESLKPETLLFFLAVGVLMCLLSEPLKSWNTAIYASIVILSTSVSLAFVFNNFLFRVSTGFNYLSSLLSIFVVLVTAFLLSNLYDRKVGKVTSNQPMISEEFNAATMEKAQDVSTKTKLNYQYPDRGARTSYELLLADNNGLLTKLRETSEAVYLHCIQMGDVSERAALLIGADAILAKAGGIYHEIGKINGKDYIQEGQRIAEEYNFPRELKAILRQHNINYEKPSSVEAVIVMLSDNVVSTMEYIKNTKENRYTADKIVDHLFQLRLSKGTFDESGLSVKDYKALRTFYQKEFL